MVPSRQLPLRQVFVTSQNSYAPQKQWRYLAKQWTESPQWHKGLWETPHAPGRDTCLLPEQAQQHLGYSLTLRLLFWIFQVPVWQFSPSSVQISGKQLTSLFLLLKPMPVLLNIQASHQCKKERKILAHSMAIPESSSLKPQSCSPQSDNSFSLSWVQDNRKENTRQKT